MNALILEAEDEEEENQSRSFLDFKHLYLMFFSFRYYYSKGLKRRYPNLLYFPD